MSGIAGVIIAALLSGGDEQLDQLEKDFLKNARQVVGRDSFDIFDDPEMLSAADAESQKVVEDPDFVIGIVHEGEAKAYPIPVMGRRELGNDTIGGLPVTVSW